MFKLIVASIAAAVALSACGGGGDSASTAPVSKISKLSFYGNPLTASSGTVAHVAVAHAASDSSASDAAAATIDSLNTALAAQGVTANVTAQVMDGTTLHQIVIGQDNGLPPTPDQFKTDPSEYMIVNFALDDMATPLTDPTQAAAITQFQSDLVVFTQRSAVAGKQVFVVMPIPTCDAAALTRTSAADGLYNAETEAGTQSSLIRVGSVGGNGITYDTGVPTLVDPTTAGHMGADCRTPDAYLMNLQTQTVAADIATRLKLAAQQSGK